MQSAEKGNKEISSNLDFGIAALAQGERICEIAFPARKWDTFKESQMLEATGKVGGRDGVNTRIEEAINNLKSGNPQQVEDAIETLQGVVYGFGMKVCGSHEDAQVTAQETLLRLARQLRDFPKARALAVWLYKVAKTQCLMSRRKSKFAPAQMLSLEELMPKDAVLSTAGTKSWQITPEEILLNRELRSRLENAVLSLPKH